MGGEPPIKVMLSAGRDRPHEATFFVWSIYTGVPYAFGWALPNSVSTLSSVSLTLLSSALIFCGVAGLAGSYWRGDLMRGLKVERGALWMRAGLAALFSMLIFTYAGVSGWTAGGFMAFLAWADLWRSRLISKDLRQIDNQVQRRC